MDQAVYRLMIDWKRLMDELRAAGWTPYRVAYALGADHPTVYHWSKGTEPRHSYGAALIVLHRHICGEEASRKLHSEARPRL